MTKKQRLNWILDRVKSLKESIPANDSGAHTVKITCPWGTVYKVPYTKAHLDQFKRIQARKLGFDPVLLC